MRRRQRSYEVARELGQMEAGLWSVARMRLDAHDMEQRIIQALLQRRAVGHWNAALERILSDRRALHDVCLGSVDAFRVRYKRAPQKLPDQLEQELIDEILFSIERKDELVIGRRSYGPLGEQRVREATAARFSRELGKRFLDDIRSSKRPLRAGAMVRDWTRNLRARR